MGSGSRVQLTNKGTCNGVNLRFMGSVFRAQGVGAPVLKDVQSKRWSTVLSKRTESQLASHN